MALKNGVVEQNLANEPAVSVFVSVPPTMRLVTTAFFSDCRQPFENHSLPENPKS